jgi:hypothetical protein
MATLVPAPVSGVVPPSHRRSWESLSLRYRPSPVSASHRQLPNPSASSTPPPPRPRRHRPGQPLSVVRTPGLDHASVVPASHPQLCEFPTSARLRRSPACHPQLRESPTLGHPAIVTGARRQLCESAASPTPLSLFAPYAVYLCVRRSALLPGEGPMGNVG